MSRILVTSARQAGLVLPLLQITTALVQRGDEVFFVSGEAFRERIEAAGATFVRLPYDEEEPPPAVTRPADHANGAREIGRLLARIFLDPVETDHRFVLGLVAELGIDLVLTEPLFVGASIVGLLPRAERPAVVSVGLFPVPFSSADTAPYGLGLPPMDGPANVLRNRALAVAAEAMTGSVRRRFVATAERLTGERVPRGGLFDLGLTVDAYAQTTVSGFEYPRRRLSSHVRFVGPLPPPPLGELPGWWDYSDRRPLVYVTQGTYANVDFGELVVPTIRALADEPVLVVATTGGPDPAAVEQAYGGPLPANARVAPLLPYTHLLASASVVVTNGGYGTVQHALRWGVPLVVSGTSEDKPEVNARVEWSGAGVNLHRHHPTPDEIRSGVRAALTDDRYRQAARRLGAQIAQSDAVGGVLAMIDESLAGRGPTGPGYPALSTNRPSTARGASR